MLLNIVALAWLCVSSCMAQRAGLQFSVGNNLVPLTSQAAFSSKTSAGTALRSNFPPETLRSIALAEQQFALDLMHRISVKVEADNREYMISPFSIWSLLALLYEGAAGETYNQLRRAMRIEVPDETLRSVYRVWSSYLNTNTSTIEVASLQALYTTKLSPLKQKYREALQYYNVQPMQVDFFNRYTPAIINEATNRSTRGLIPYTVLPQDIYGVKMFLLSSLFFQGQWKYQFDRSLTSVEPFYNEKGGIVAYVPMMSQEEEFVFLLNVPGLNGFVVDLPYGQLDRLSMIIVLPKIGYKLSQITSELKDLGLTPILTEIEHYKRNSMEGNKAHLKMPKFTTTTDILLKDILAEMGITDLFNEKLADLSRMGDDLFANLCVHSTKIIVDERGTTAGAVSAATLDDRLIPRELYLNRPFQYMIVDKSTSLLLFTGQVRNPKAA